MRLPKYLQNAGILIVLSVVAISINIVQFPSINSDASTHHKAIHRYDTSDVLELGANNIFNTHNVFIEIRELNEGNISILVPGSHRLLRRNDNYRARLLGLVQPTNITSYSTRSDRILDTLNLENIEPIASGHIWEWPGNARAEDMDTATAWSIYTRENPDYLVLIDLGEESPEMWTFVDLRLLPQELHEELR